MRATTPRRHSPLARPPSSHARCGRAGHRDTPEVVAQHRLQHPWRRPRADAVRAGIFRMHRRVDQRQPRASRGCRVAGDVGIADGRHRPPQVVVVLGLEHRDEGVAVAIATSANSARAVGRGRASRATASWRTIGFQQCGPVADQNLPISVCSAVRLPEPWPPISRISLTSASRSANSAPAAAPDGIVAAERHHPGRELGRWSS